MRLKPSTDGSGESNRGRGDGKGKRRVITTPPPPPPSPPFETASTLFWVEAELHQMAQSVVNGDEYTAHIALTDPRTKLEGLGYSGIDEAEDTTKRVVVDVVEVVVVVVVVVVVFEEEACRNDDVEETSGLVGVGEMSLRKDLPGKTMGSICIHGFPLRRL
ncbi:hypothetical protein M0802_005864 [Mischocyttarus mexicanus]|nr:hypothetical protein M0802_005864 [Mischocyttarus mexicanus]